MKKRAFPLVIALAALYVATSLTASAAEKVTNGACGDNVCWVLDDTGTLTISGTGPMRNYSLDAPWLSYNAEIQTVVVEDGVTAIGADAFAYCSSVTSVTIPSSVTSIGRSAFSACSDLESIVIPKSVSSIGKYAFKDCNNLTEIIVDSENSEYTCEDGILFTEDMSVLIRCPAGHERTSYYVPAGVEQIETYAFSGCANLSSITLPDGVTTLGEYAFFNCTGLNTGAADHNLSVMVKIGWVTQEGNTATQYYAYSESVIMDMAEWHINNRWGVYNCLLSGTSSRKNITFSAVIRSETNVELAVPGK